MTERHPLFVGGTGRSGTTLVARLLGSHADYHMIPIEVRFIVDPGGLCDLVAGRCEIDRFEERLKGRWWHRTVNDGGTRGLHKLIDEEAFHGAVDRFSRRVNEDPLEAGRGLVFDLLDPVASQNAALGWIEMTPPNVARGADLARLIPGMRLVHSIRDGRDVAASVSRMFWGPDDPFDALDWWAQRMLEAFRACEGLRPDELYVMQMEDLVFHHREETANEVLGFAGLDMTEDVRAWLDGYLKHDRANRGRWRSVLPEDAWARFDKAYRAHLDRLAESGVRIPREDGLLGDMGGSGRDQVGRSPR